LPELRQRQGQQAPASALQLEALALRLEPLALLLEPLALACYRLWETFYRTLLEVLIRFFFRYSLLLYMPLAVQVLVLPFEILLSKYTAVVKAKNILNYFKNRKTKMPARVLTILKSVRN
jgi:hypothetical protein